MSILGVSKEGLGREAWYVAKILLNAFSIYTLHIRLTSLELILILVYLFLCIKNVKVPTYFLRDAFQKKSSYGGTLSQPQFTHSPPSKVGNKIGRTFFGLYNPLLPIKLGKFVVPSYVYLKPWILVRTAVHFSHHHS